MEGEMDQVMIHLIQIQISLQVLIDIMMSYQSLTEIQLEVEEEIRQRRMSPVMRSVSKEKILRMRTGNLGEVVVTDICLLLVIDPRVLEKVI